MVSQSNKSALAIKKNWMHLIAGHKNYLIFHRDEHRYKCILYMLLYILQGLICSQYVKLSWLGFGYFLPIHFHTGPPKNQLLATPLDYRGPYPCLQLNSWCGGWSTSITFLAYLALWKWSKHHIIASYRYICHPINIKRMFLT